MHWMQVNACTMYDTTISIDQPHSFTSLLLPTMYDHVHVHLVDPCMTISYGTINVYISKIDQETGDELKISFVLNSAKRIIPRFEGKTKRKITL